MRRALGKGLTQLLTEEGEGLDHERPDETPVEAVTPGPSGPPSGPPAPATPTGAVDQVPVSSIIANPRQPRGRFDEDALSELADSIREHGVIQPLVVRPLGEGRFELIAGERRLRAAQKAGLTRVPVVVRRADPRQSLEVALIENVQREDISPMECALAYRRLMEEFGASQEQVAIKVGKTRAAVANTLRLLKLPPEVQAAIDEGGLSEGHARALLMADGPVRQLRLFARVVREGLSVRETERLARGEAKLPAPAPAPKAGSPPRKVEPELVALEDGLRELFGAPTTIERREVGGRLTIEFYSDDDLERILEVVGFSL